MSLNNHQSLAIQALEQMKGDDLYRAELAFKGMTPRQLDSEWGQSGKSCREILAEYQAHDARIDAAIAWVKGQKE